MKQNNLKTIILFCLALLLKGDAIQKTNFLERSLKDFQGRSSPVLVYSDEEINAYSNSDQLRLIESQRKKIIKTAKRHQFFLFGDFHLGNLDNEFLISLLPDLKKAGCKNLAVEIDYTDQREIDNYLYVHRNPKIFQNNIHYDISPYLDVIDVANDLGFMIWGFDHRSMIGPADARREGDFSNFGSDRNKRMYENLARFFNIEKKVVQRESGGVSIYTNQKKAKDVSKTKFVVLTGANHTNEKPTLHAQTNKIENTLGFYLVQNSFRVYSLSLTDYPPYTNHIDEVFPVYSIRKTE